MTRSEEVLLALHAALQTRLIPLGVKAVRNEAVPTRIPAAGYVCLHDGEPGEPEVLMSPITYVYEHLAEIDVVVSPARLIDRDPNFDAVKAAIGQAISADRTLGGLCDYVLADAPAPTELPLEGAETLKAATIGVILTYQTSDPLA